MSNFWKAMAEFEPTPSKKFYLTFGETTIEVTLEKYKEVTTAGIENFAYKNEKIVRLKKLPVEQRQPTLASAGVGYHFYKQNPFWAMKHSKGGFEWKIEQEFQT
ncbi:MAG: hypothetical protein CBD74_09005 [Saprospirales bacterium TMED214]|nr:MAG: hypothetical protein CBD74_09005 [Saprospirales bacterium TMED214]